MRKIFFTLLVYMLGLFTTQAQTADWSAVKPDFFPTNISGQIHGISRVSQMKFHPSNPNIYYAISARGGLFISQNAGNTWTVAPGTDFMPYARLASICIDHTNDQILYLGTGDHNYYYTGSGVWKSTNGGLTFSPLGLSGRLVVDMMMDPLNNQVIVAVTDAGIYKTSNAGATWTLKTAARPFDDLKQRSPNSRVLYAASADSAFFRSMDFGETWNQITAGIVLPAGITNGNGCRIALSAADTNLVYLGMVANAGIVYRSTDGGTTFTARKVTASPYLAYYTNSASSSGQGNYNFGLGADNVNPNILYYVAHCVWKSTDGGLSWTKLTDWWAEVHTDMHQMVTSPYNNNLLYNMNDGGVWLSTNGGLDWIPKSDGMNGYEIYHGNCSPTRKDMISIGTQDNGELFASTSGWTCNRGGDWGSQCSFDYRPNSSMVYYHSSNKRRLVTGSESTYGLPSRVTNLDDIAFHRSNPDLAFVADSFIYRTTNLTAASPAWLQIAATGKRLMAIHSSFADPNRLYAIASDGTFYVSTNALSASPIFTTSTLPNSSNNLATITSIKQNPNVIYISINTKVYRSADNGSTWTNITYNLPNVNHRRILADEYYSGYELVFIASANTVYYKIASANNWSIYNTQLPSRTDAIDLSIFNDSTSNSVLRYACYGRSVWETPINNLRQLTANFSANTTTPCSGTQVQFSDLSTGNVVSRNWSFPGGSPSSSIASNPIITYSGTGTYTVSLTVSDGVNNSTITRPNYISTLGGALPLTEGFEGVQTPPQDWKIIDNGTQGIAWAASTLAGGYASSPTSMMFDNYSWNYPGEKDELYVRPINLNGLTSCKLLFDVAYQVFSGYSDSLAVWISTNCGATFTKLYQKGGTILSTAGSGGNNFVPTSAQWRTDTVTLNAYINQPNVLIAFQNINGYGNKLYLDNINLITTCNPPSLPTLQSTAASICVGQSTTLGIVGGNLNSAAQWVWYAGSCGGTFIGSGNSVTVSPSTTTTYYVRGEGNCVLSGACQSITITVNPLPLVSATSVSTCAGQAVTLSGNPAGGSFSVVNPYTGPTTSYTYTYTDLQGCTNTSTPASITVNPLPAVTGSVSPNDTVCLQTAVSLSGSGAQTYVWSNGITNGSFFSALSSQTYTVTGTNQFGCTASNTVTLYVPNNVPLVSNTSRCGPGTLNLNASGPGTMKWYDSMSGGTLLHIGTTYSPSLNVTDTFYVDQTSVISNQILSGQVGPLSNSIGSGVMSTLSQYMIFNVHQLCTLQSVIVYPGAAGNVILEQRNSTGTQVINSITFPVNAAQVGTAVTVPLNWILTPGNAYRLYRGSSGVALYRNGAGAVYPYSHPWVSITGNSLNAAHYYWAYHWTLNQTNQLICTSERVPVTGIIQNCNTPFSLKAYLQGYYDIAGTMQPVLMNQGVGVNPGLTDTVQVELRQSYAPYALAASSTMVLNTLGEGNCIFPLDTGSYYIVVKHRNTLTTWSSAPLIFNGTPLMYNFSDLASKAYGQNQKEMEPGIWALYSGDILQDENMDLLDAGLLENAIQAFLSGYLATDINGDGNVDLLDNPVLEDNIAQFIYSIHP